MSVTPQKNGDYWQARWIDSAGNEQRRSLGAIAKVSKAEAKRKCLALDMDHASNPGRRDSGKAPRLSDWLREYPDQRTDLDELTLKKHVYTGTLLTRYFNPEIRLDQITRKNAADFRAWLSKQTFRRGAADDKDAKDYPLQDSTIRGHIALAKVMLNRAKRQDLIPYNPFDQEVVGEPSVFEEWMYIGPEQFDAILAACPTAGWKLAVSLARLGALRFNEIFRAEWGWINWETHTLAIPRKRRRNTTKSRSRVVPLQPALYDMLAKAFAEVTPGSARICSETPRELFHALKRIIRQAKVPAYARPWHTLRKSMASDWCSNPKLNVADISKWTGDRVEVLMRHYHQTKRDTLAIVTGTDSAKPTQKPTQKSDPTKAEAA